VRPRPDVPPHTLLTARRAQQQIPPDIAADPERLALWNKNHHETEASLDQAGATYEVTGCGQTTMYVCSHPTVAEVMTGSPFIVGDASFVENDVIALSAVECVPPLGAQLDVMARIQGPDVVHIPLHTPLPTVPDTLRGLRVLSLDKIISSRVAGQVDPTHAAVATGHASQGGCAKEAARIFEPLGWQALLDPVQPHDLVARADCSANAAVATVSGAMYVLLPSRAREDGGMRLETPTGELIDQLQTMPLTLACPIADEAQCIQAVKEYAAAHFVGQVVGSAKLAAFVTQLRSSR
jgi:hypothetical protein